MHILGTIVLVIFAIWLFDRAMMSSIKRDKERKEQVKEEQLDRLANPEKWKKLDSEKRKLELSTLETEYKNTQIPARKWILMDKHEKSSVLEKREQLTIKIENLKALIKQKG
jgi:hypothetical protein